MITLLAFFAVLIFIGMGISLVQGAIRLLFTGAKAFVGIFIIYIVLRIGGLM